MMACAMIVTLNHGNINVIFSVVALAFVLEIDGKISLLYIFPCIFIFLSLHWPLFLISWRQCIDGLAILHA
jgi:hypothetical protein